MGMLDLLCPEQVAFSKGAVYGSPTTRDRLYDVKDRLLFILRRALKTRLPGDLYREWLSSDKDVQSFLHQKRGTLVGKKFGF